MDTIKQDVRYSFKLLFKNPGFTLAAILSLSFGIGINTSIFSIVNAILIRPLPITEPERVVEIYTSGPDGSRYNTTSYPDYTDLVARNEVLSGIAAYELTPLNLSSSGYNERVFGEMVSGNYFSLMGLEAIKGRTFLPDEDKTPGASPIVVLSYNLWRNNFGADPDMVGKTLLLNGHQFTVIGIMPRYFTGTYVGISTGLWVPLMMHEQVKPGSNEREQRASGSLFLKGRLKPGVTLEQAQANLSSLASALEKEYPTTNQGRGVTIVKASSVRINPEITDTLSIVSALLLAIVSLVLLIACFNIANLLLARAANRRKEIAIRLAMGATRARLIRQLLTESLVLSMIGGAVGLLLANWVMRVLIAFRPPIPIPVKLDFAIDTRVLIFTLVASLVTGLVFGLVPALQASKPDLIPALKGEGVKIGKGYRRFGLRNLLVVAQVAVSLFLLVSAGLFIRSLQSTQEVDPGFNVDNLAIMSLDLSLNGYSEARAKEFYDRAIEQIKSQPSVQAASWAKSPPLGLSSQSMPVSIEGYEPPPDVKRLEVNYNIVSPKYFETMGIAILQGRDFALQDNERSSKIAIINETMAQRFWPGQNPIGKRITRQGGQPSDFEVIGVVKNSKYLSLGEDPLPYFYLPLNQNYESTATLHVRTDRNSLGALPDLQRTIRTLDETLPVFDAKTMSEHLRIALLPARVGATLLGSFGLLALVLSSVGMYGIMSYSVARRTHEIGIRRALGASDNDVLRLVLGEAIILTSVGILVGLIAALVAARVLSGFLYGVSAIDPLTYVAVSLLLSAVVIASSYIPARKVMRVAPKSALVVE